VNLTLPEWLAFPPAWLLPWHAALILAALSLCGFLVARLQFRRAREDFANAFFYSPSSKTKQRHRRQRWQDRMIALAALTVLCLVIAAVLYVRELL
jgi:hypothetical protein